MSNLRSTFGNMAREGKPMEPCVDCKGTGRHLSENETYHYKCVTCGGSGNTETPSGHTPGPWKANRYPKDQNEVADHTITSGVKVLGFCPTGYPFDNAVLMAAAPDLLETSEALLVIVSQTAFVDTGGIIHKATEVIQKARGEGS